MMPWQDDNALMFKLANLKGAAGFLGPGALGDGPYKYAATFYLPVYWFFGYRYLSMYFLLCLVLYYLATITICKTFSYLLGKVGGRFAGLFFACGYIASDGFIRLYNSAGTSISLILSSLLLYSYWKFYKTNKYLNYWLATIFYWLSSELVRYRTHYLILVIVSFEIIYFVLANKKTIKNLSISLVRLILPGVIFYHYFILNLDSRSGGVVSLLRDLLKGRFYTTFSLVGTFANITIPGWISNILWNTQYFLVEKLHFDLPFAAIIATLLLTLGIFRLVRSSKWRKLAIALWLLLSIFWYFVSRMIYSTNLLSINEYDLFITYIGGLMFVLVGIFLFKIESKVRALYLFLLIWLVANIGGYSAYLPNFICLSDHRYLSHSFIALSGIFGLFAMIAISKKRRDSTIILGIIVFLSLGNLFKGVIILSRTAIDRSAPVRAFYQQLKKFKPTATKGDLFYFDVSKGVEMRFADAFSVAQMPEETAIAWRYGLDRDDIVRFVEFNELLQYIKDNKVDLEKINTYLYNKDGLKDTSTQVRNLLRGGLLKKTLAVLTETDATGKIINLSDGVVSLTPLEISLEISSTPIVPAFDNFPLVNNVYYLANTIYNDPSLRTKAFAYVRAKKAVLSMTTVSTSSAWEKNVGEYLLDQNLDTFWRSDRILWSKEKEAAFTLDLKKVTRMDRVVWINADANNAPVDYAIDISLDGKQWERVTHIKVNEKIQRGLIKEVAIGEHQTRYVKMVIYKTLQGDSPEILEAWVVPSEFSKLDIQETEEFLQRPLIIVPNQMEYLNTLRNISYTGQVKLYWINDKENDWSVEFKTLSVKYDGKRYIYKVLLPAGGTKITKIKLNSSEIPGVISVYNIWVSNPKMEELD